MRRETLDKFNESRHALEFLHQELAYLSDLYHRTGNETLAKQLAGHASLAKCTAKTIDEATGEALKLFVDTVDEANTNMVRAAIAGVQIATQ